MIRYLPFEVFKEIELDVPRKHRFAVSDYGRVLRFTDTMENGEIIIPPKVEGYRILKFSLPKGSKPKTKSFLVYKLVAQLFVPKTNEDQLFVIHLDMTKDNDSSRNLKWVNHEDRMTHFRNNPKVQESQRRVTEFNRKANGSKLTETTVIRLKKILLDPNRKTRMKILAKQFGVSEMQLYRIKSGENWGHIQVNSNPKNETK